MGGGTIFPLASYWGKAWVIHHHSLSDPHIQSILAQSPTHSIKKFSSPYLFLHSTAATLAQLS